MDKLNITKCLPNLNIEKVEKLQEVLLNLGICEDKELIFVEADDLSSVLSTIQARKLISKWGQEFGNISKRSENLLSDEPMFSISSENISINDGNDNDSSNDTITVSAQSDLEESSSGSSSILANKTLTSDCAVKQCWPAVFEVPDFGEDVTSYLESRKDEKNMCQAIPYKFRKKIVDVLFETMSKFTMYPERYQYHQVCNALVSKHPCLRDRFSLDGSYYMVWLDSIRTKFKEARRCETTSDFQQKMKQKYGQFKRKGTRSEDESSCKRKKRSSVVAIVLEDDTTITKHKRFMELELQKSVPSLDLVLDRMNRTFGERRAVISKEIVSVEKICQEYPALKIADMVIQEMQKLYQCDFKLLSGGVIAAKITSIVSWKKVPQAISDVYGEGTSPLICAPAAFNENWDSFVIVNKEPASPYPTLVLKDSKYELLIEGCHINGIKDFIHGLSTLISAYWVFDIEFPPSLKKTLIFLCGYVLKLPKVKMMPSVQRIINKLGQ